MTVNISFDGPVFWTRQVAYLYCCSCHFEEHEGPLLTILKKFEARVERVCLVDSPVDYAFLPDSIFAYMARCMPRLEVIVHKCRNYEVLEDFRNLPQLLVVKGEIQGLKAMLGADVENGPKSLSSSLPASGSTSTDVSEISDGVQQIAVTQRP